MYNNCCSKWALSRPDEGQTPWESIKTCLFALTLVRQKNTTKLNNAKLTSISPIWITLKITAACSNPNKAIHSKVKETGDIRRRTRYKSRERRKKNTEAVRQLSGVTYMQPCHWVRDSMKYGQRVGAEGLIKRHHKRRQSEPKTTL